MGKDVAKDSVRDLMQGTKQAVTITLYVSAEDLYNVNPQPPNQAELDAYCILGDNNNISRGKPENGGDLNTFTSQVYVGKQVTWVGKNIESNAYQVSIDQISNAGNIFPQNTLTGSGGRVSGTPNQAGNDTYRIHFSISKPGEGSKSHTLDPKLGGNN